MVESFYVVVVIIIIILGGGVMKTFYFKSDKLTVEQQHAGIECMDLDRLELHTFVDAIDDLLGCFENRMH